MYLIKSIFISMSMCAGSISAIAWTAPVCDTSASSIACYSTSTIVFDNNQRTQEVGFAVTADANRESIPIFFIGDAQWIMQNRSKLSAMVKIDRYGYVEREAGTFGKYVGIRLLLQDLEFFAEGSMVYVSLPNFSASYSLRGSRAAIKSVLSAYTMHTRQADPFERREPADPFTNDGSNTSLRQRSGFIMPSLRPPCIRPSSLKLTFQ